MFGVRVGGRAEVGSLEDLEEVGAGDQYCLGSG